MVASRRNQKIEHVHEMLKELATIIQLESDTLGNHDEIVHKRVDLEIKLKNLLDRNVLDSIE